MKDSEKTKAAVRKHQRLSNANRVDSLQEE